MRLGLLGGTFDPVHLGHLVMAEMARHRFELDRVVWIPAGDPPHKRGEAVTPAEHRLAMVRLAIQDNPGFEVSRWELDHPGPSYTLRTVQGFAALYPGADLRFLTGADSILEFLTWHRHEELIEACRFIAATRPGYDLAGLRETLPPRYQERIDLLPLPWIDLSSTELRERFRAGEPVRYLVPDPVEAYARTHRLYVARPSGDTAGPVGRGNPGTPRKL